MDTVVIYPGRFHPFHKGHKSVYDTLVKRFGKDRVYIATSNKVDPPKSPFTFDEKRAMMALTGVDQSRVVQVKNPYQATEITDNYDPQNTIALFAVSDKDMAEDPRFSFKPRKDGQPSYYQPAQKDMVGFDKHAYIVTIPTLQFNVLGEPMRSATEFRANFARADSEKQKSMITDLFGRYDPNVHKTMAQKIVEQLQRADEILDKLIELGADDEYILEACARVDMLKNQVLKENRRQSLYQAIMEGGHSLPVMEDELACPVAAGDLAVNTENRDRTIKQFNYGPLNVDVPGDYWKDIAEYWNTTEEAARASNCGNCVAFDISKRMKDCLPGDTFDDDGELGYCWMHHFKCHSARSCHTWAKGGPIEKDGESAEWQGKAFGAQGVKEEITDYNKQDPMNSVIAIRGIGTMSISSALEKVSEMALDIAKLGAMKDAKNVQDNLPRYMDLLATYNESIQEAYRELAAQRKRGGTASRGIDKDISEGNSKAPTKNDLDLDNVNPMFKNIVRTALVKYPFAKDSMDAVLHMMMNQLKKDDNQNKEIGRLDKENDQQDNEIDQIEKDVKNLTFAREDSDRWDRFFSRGKYKDLFGDDDDWIKDIQPVTGGRRKGKQPPLDFDPFGDVKNEHCGDPMAPDHAKDRALLYKLYRKGLNAVPGSQEHKEILGMIADMRKKIGLDEGITEQEISQADLDKIAGDTGISTDLLNKRLDKESNRKHFNKSGKVKVGDTHLKHKAYGIGQVRQPALDDINADYGTNFTVKDLQNPAKNAKISALYLKLAKEKYADKFAPGKDAEAYANLAYQYGPDVPADLVKKLPDADKKKPMYDPIKSKSTMPTQGQSMDAKDAIAQTMKDPFVQQKLGQVKQAGSNLAQIGKDILGGKTTLSKATDFEKLPKKVDQTLSDLIGTDINVAQNVAQGKVNKDSWAYKNIVAPFMKGAKGYSDSLPNYYKGKQD